MVEDSNTTNRKAAASATRLNGRVMVGEKELGFDVVPVRSPHRSAECMCLRLSFDKWRG